jgi:hypothetical protein
MIILKMTNLILKCPRCSHIWTYKGKNKFVTSCSNCKTSVYLKKNTIPSNSVVGPVGKTESKAQANNIATESEFIVKTPPSSVGADIEYDIDCD